MLRAVAKSEIDANLDELVARALAEDIGSGDVTTAATVPADARARARITQKAPGVVYGLEVATRAFWALDPGAVVEHTGPEGVWREHGPVLELTGSAAALLSAERTALNFLAQLSGVATLTARCVQAVAGTGARILDTRKTVPGLRALQKRAVACGGGVNHRFGLFDEILIKENHAAIAGGVEQAIRAAHAHSPQLALVVECTGHAELEQALSAWEALGSPQRFRILLDNMDTPALRAAVAQVAGRVPLEASGGFTLETIRAVAETGVDFISVGALTHSAPALDLSLLLEPLP